MKLRTALSRFLRSLGSNLFSDWSRDVRQKKFLVANRVWEQWGEGGLRWLHPGPNPPVWFPVGYRLTRDLGNQSRVLGQEDSQGGTIRVPAGWSTISHDRSRVGSSCVAHRIPAALHTFSSSFCHGLHWRHLLLLKSSDVLAEGAL